MHRAPPGRTAVTAATLTSVLVIVGAVALAPAVADLLRRRLPIPTVVLEIALGILIGPAVLGIAQVDDLVGALAAFGLAMLFFLAGYEIDFARIRGGPLARAAGSWAASLLLGVGMGVALAAVLGGGWPAGFILGLALATTALGAILPILRDAGLLATPIGASIMAVGAVGEFAPLLAVAILLSGGRPVYSTAMLGLLAAVAVAAGAIAMRTTHARINRLIGSTLATSAQFAVRLSVLAVLAMVWLATELHLDLVLGAFAAGVVMKLVLARISPDEVRQVESKIEGLGFGFLIPFFFVVTGVQFDVAALLGSPTALVLVPAALLAFLLVRGVPVAIGFRRHFSGRQRLTLGLFGSTTLPLVVVITSLGVDNGHLSAATAAGLVGAAVASVLIFPLVALRLSTTGRHA
jgi:Kef-type K+ transport system membrane component KefB